MDTAPLNSTMSNEEDMVIEGSVGGPYMVEKIVGIYMGKDKKKYFRVKWLDSWEPAENLSEGCQSLIDEFWCGTNQDNGGKPVSKHNLQLGQKIIKTEEVLYPEVIPPINVSSSTEQRGSVSSTNDYKVDVSSSNDRRHNVTSSNKKRNSQPTNQNRNTPTTNQKKNTSTTSQNKNTSTTNQSKNTSTTNQNKNTLTTNQNRSTPTTKQNRSTQLTNQNRNSHSSGKKNNLNRPTPTIQKTDSKNKRNKVESSPSVHKETVTSTNIKMNNSTTNHNVSSNSHGDVTFIDEKAALLPPMEKPLILSSPKTPSLSSPNKDILPSPNKKTKSSPLQKVETSIPHQKPVTSPDTKKEGKLPDTTLIPDEGESESKLNLRNKSPLTIKTDMTTSSEQQINPSSSHPSSHPPSTHPSPSRNKQEFHSEPITSNTTMHDINTVPIKMASPTSVVPVEATSTIEDDADLDDGMKSGMSSPSPNAKKQLKFNNPEFLPQTTDESSSKESSKSLVVQSYEVEADNSQSFKNINSLAKLPYKDRHNVLHSSPYFSDMPDSDYDQDNESVSGAQNNFRNVVFGNEIESNEEGNHFINVMDRTDNYVMDNDEEQNNFINYNDDVTDNTHRMNSGGNNFRDVLLDNGVENNFSTLMDLDGNSYVNVLDEDGNNYENIVECDAQNYDRDSWVEGNQYNESLIGEYDSQSEDVIALDSDDNENDKDDLEFIVCIDSSQKRHRGRLPASLQQSRQPGVATSRPIRGKVTNQRVRRGRPAQRGRLVGNAATTSTNDQTTNSGGSVPPLVHPRLLLNSPQTQTEDPITPTPRRQRGNKRGGGSSRSANNMSKNVESSPPQNNQQNSIVVSANSAFTTPTRKRQRPLTQPTMVNGGTSNSDVHVHTKVTPPQNKIRKPSLTGNLSSDVQQNLDNSPLPDYSPSRAILNDRTCTICNHAFANLTLARQHAKQVHANQYGSPSSSLPSLVCQVCKAMFKTNKDLKSHMLLHGNLNLHKCEVCFRAFKQRSVLAQHLLIHSDELPYACSICDKRFRQQGHLILHLGTHGRNNEGTYTCPHCSIDFTDENSFAEHMREHDAELPFKCNFCQQRFELKSNLMLHLEGHNEGRPFTCHICKKSFKTKTYYFGHMQMHKIRGNQNNANQGNDFDNMEGDFNHMKNK